MNTKNLLDPLKSYFFSHKTLTFDHRFRALEQLEKLILENEKEICAALFEDLHKPLQEAVVSEIELTLAEIRLAKKKLSSWMKPQKRKAPLALFPSQSRTYYEPLGVVLIIGPWNYPFHLIMAPLVGALAAGNCAVVKPSENCLNTSRLIKKLVARYFDEDYILVVEGGVDETTVLLNLSFDHIFFTGSTSVGKIVMQAAAKNLTPVTLELGGKSPVIVCEDADLDLTARRVVWGKFYNAGQTCVAPDYLYVHEQVAEKLIEKLKINIHLQLGDSPNLSENYARIVNLKNCKRLAGLIDPSKVITGGEIDQETLYVAPTMLKDMSWSDPVMQEEIFGPLLPIFTYREFSELLRFLTEKPKPLAAYCFTRSTEKQSYFLQNFSFGGGCINDVLMHLSNPNLSFGGVGGSGMGRYHGHDSFLTFSHAKSVLHRFFFLDFSARYAPYSKNKLSFMRRVFRLN